MLKIYAIPVSLYCAKLRILLRHKGLKWEETPPPGGYGSDEYKTHVPSGNLPALRDGDLLIADSEAIAEYLEETHPEPPMLPKDTGARAEIRARSRFHDTRLEPALRTLFPYLKRGPAPGALIATQGERISQHLAHLVQMLGPTDQLTLGDCGFPITFAWLDALSPHMGLAVEWPREISAYRRHLAEHPAVAGELADYVPKLTNYLTD